MLKSRSSARMAVPTCAAMACLALASCGGTASDPSTSSAPDACTVGAVMVPIRALLDTSETRATVAERNGDLRCASGIARITILIGAVSAPSDGPQGTPHLVLLEDVNHHWVIANDKLCDASGQPATPIPSELGDVCDSQ